MAGINLGKYKIFNSELESIMINKSKLIINTINAHSYIVAKEDLEFKKALEESDILLPDGEGIVLMAKVLTGNKIKKIAGADIHLKLLEQANKENLRCFYLGSSDKTLALIKLKISKKYPNIKFGFLSPPFKKAFSEDDTQNMIQKINDFETDILFVGLTAPKQEKWVSMNKALINAKVICSIGAVFDFVAETKKRAPTWIIDRRFEWLYRCFTEWRLMKRYLYSTPLFLIEVYKLKYFKNKKG
jgi:N-acetylglucosaminyldiphosphoundecaprenol N-acetyl-beta-D-mannosaminyltransferase